MEINHAIAALGALAQETRLDVFRYLVAAGGTDVAAGRIARDLGVPPATLSFHLNQLKHAGLVTCRKNGRSMLYGADFDGLDRLMGYLTENCCRGACGTGRLAFDKGATRT